MTTQQRHHPHSHPLGPSYTATVVLDIGGDIGALVVHTDATELGREIEISDATRPEAPRTHSAVRERIIGARSSHCAVYPQVPAGRYLLWDDADTPAGEVTVTGGRVTEYRWAAPPPGPSAA
ncbi:MAG: phospholipase [Actinocatenispora sp.]